MTDNVAGQTAVNSTDQYSGSFAEGKVTFDSTSITAGSYYRVACGFKPRYVQYVNATDRITVEWYEGMADDTSIKTAAAGTRTLETTNKGITVDSLGFRVSQNATLAAIAASTVGYWVARQ